MSGYQGRTGPNFSQFINGLNELSPESNDFGNEDTNDFDNDLAMYTNTDFTNIDMPNLRGNVDDAFALDYSASNHDVPHDNFSDLLATSDFDTDFGLPTTTIAQAPVQQQQTVYYNPPTQIPRQQPVATYPAQYPTVLQPRAAGQSPIDHISAEKKAQLNAEEDKRRRNTAASARFRVKKKQREQRLEDDLKTKSLQLAHLQTKLQQSEFENKYLKSLLFEKNGLSNEEIKAAYEQHRRESEERELKAEGARPGEATK